MTHIRYTLSLCYINNTARDLIKEALESYEDTVLFGQKRVFFKGLGLTFKALSGIVLWAVECL